MNYDKEYKEIAKLAASIVAKAYRFNQTTVGQYYGDLYHVQESLRELDNFLK